MINILIDGKKAVLKTGSSFKLTRSNPLFTDSGDYSLEVTLPLAGCPENQAIFGMLHRQDVSKTDVAGTKHTFYLSTPETDLSGSAVVTSISEEEIKVQALAGRSNFNFDMTDDEDADIYIDELDLGNAYEDEHKAVYGSEKTQTMDSTIDMLMNAPDMSLFYNHTRAMYGTADMTNCVVFPIYSTTDDAYANQHYVHHFYNATQNTVDSVYWGLKLSKTTQAIPRTGGTIYLLTDNVLAPQPYLVYIIEKIIRALGYSISTSDNEIRQTWMANILIANARGTIKLNQILPHWTVKEFFEQVQAFFGVIITVDGTTAKVQRKATLYGDTENTHYIKEVVDEYSVDVDENATQDDPAAGNVAYAFDSIPNHLVLPDEVFDYATIKHFNSYTEITEFVATLSDDEKAKSSYLFIDDTSRFKFALLETSVGFEIRPVDMMGGLYRDDDRDIDTSLKFVPVAFDYRTDASLRRSFIRIDTDPEGEYSNWVDTDHDVALAAPCLSTDDTRVVTGYDSYSINDLINEEADTDTNKRDIIEVAVNSPDTVSLRVPAEYGDSSYRTLGINQPVGNPYYTQETNVYLAYVRRFSFLLNFNKQDQINIPVDQESMQTTVFDSYSPADSRTEWVISFLDKGRFEPGNLFIIRGKKFLCQKLEFTVTEDGISELKKGYFYEVG